MYILVLLRRDISLNMAYNISLDISIPAFSTPQAYYRTHFVNSRWERHLCGCLIRPNANVSNSRQAWLLKKRSAIPIQTVLNDKPPERMETLSENTRLQCFWSGFWSWQTPLSALNFFAVAIDVHSSSSEPHSMKAYFGRSDAFFWYWYHQFYSSSLILFPGKKIIGWQKM